MMRRLPLGKCLALLVLLLLLDSCGKNTETIRELVSPPVVTPPEITWLSYPPAPWHGDETVTFRVDADTTVRVVRMTLDVASTPFDSIIAPALGDTLRFTIPTHPMNEGFHLLLLEAEATNGALGKSNPLPIEVRNADITPPTVQWLYPTSGTDLTGLVGLPFHVEDDRGVEAVHVFRNGIEADGDTLDGTPGNRTYEWNSEAVDDGYYTFELVATDSSGNEGHSLALLTHVVNQSTPRIITIPTDYTTIQAGINASKSGDTLRVLPGNYNEGLNFFGKNVWFESTDGPEVTTIDANGWTYGILIQNGEDSTFVIRGFSFKNAIRVGIAGYGGNFSIYNCIISHNEYYGLFSGGDYSNIINCIFDMNGYNLLIAYNWGKYTNNISINCNTWGVWNTAVYPNPIILGNNLYYNNINNFNVPSLDSDTDLFQNPNFINGTYLLSLGSPCIDTGNPAIFDLDRSRSDIGVYGGPYAYPPPN